MLNGVAGDVVIIFMAKVFHLLCDSNKPEIDIILPQSMYFDKQMFIFKIRNYVLWNNRICAMLVNFSSPFHSNNRK
ncbi:Hypothetical predicted protein [Drosophila guanche]|uniref:Uncharacterized protein n=1 Tax=Drosophila guanche TaxID=7266 RepID=A0A3B0JBN1_DROGU|nr:Hypothetical predicted protein [Drosophila guanche]